MEALRAAKKSFCVILCEYVCMRCLMSAFICVKNDVDLKPIKKIDNFVKPFILKAKFV